MLAVIICDYNGVMTSGAALAQWQCPPLHGKVGCSIYSHWVDCVALLGQEHSPQPPRQEANVRLQPATKIYWIKTNLNYVLAIC